jgi:hypothetical protein
MPHAVMIERRPASPRLKRNREVRRRLNRLLHDFYGHFVREPIPPKLLGIFDGARRRPASPGSLER